MKNRARTAGRSSAKGKQLPTIELTMKHKGRQFKFLGILFAKTKEHLIVLNNVVGGANLGRLKKLRKEHLNPEADIYIFPRKTIGDTRILK